MNPDPLDLKTGAEIVYIVECGDNIKIGYSRNPIARISTMQTGNPQEVKLVCLILSSNMSMLETLLHERYANYATRGEWFQLRQQYVVADIAACIARGEIDASIFMPIRRDEHLWLPKRTYAPRDEFYEQAFSIVKLEGRASINLFMHRLNIGYRRAAYIYTDMERNRVFSRMGLRKQANGGYR